MLRQRRITPIRPPVADWAAASPLRPYQRAFLDWTRASGLAEQTALIRKMALDFFIRWCDGRDIDDVTRITTNVLEEYQGYLFQYRKLNGRPLAMSTQVTRLNPLKAFFKWLARTRQIVSNPALDLIIPRVPRRLPGRVLTITEVDRILSQPDLGTLGGVRDRAILEVLYSTGIRRMELVKIELRDIIPEENSLFVRGAKGGRDRVVPLGRRTCEWIERYLRDVRAWLAKGVTDNSLFLTDYGEPFSKNRLGDLVKRYLWKARVPVPGACHTFRHACATHMLENGADIRFIQQLLGHEKLDTTAIYTEVSIKQLQEVHARCHPSAKIVEKPLPPQAQKV